MTDEAPRVTTSLSGVVGPGLRLKDRYRIEKELGRGGIGVVYLAQDEQLHNRPVVIKVLLERSAESEWFQKKFKQEIEALVRIDHPGVVGALDVGEMPDGKPFFVMQFVQGANLRSLMKEGALDLPQVASIIRQVGTALSAAHEKGVYHRDLKPENIMLQDLGHGERLAKIIDFGIATVHDPADQGSQHTQIAGSVLYMAPEQLMGKPEAASDIYALGVIAYELLTGEPPFRPSSPFELPALHREGVKVMPTERRSDLSPDVDAAILRALAFAPKDRHPTAREFAEELSRALTGEVKTQPPRPPLAATDPTFRVPSGALVPTPSGAIPGPTFRVPTQAPSGAMHAPPLPTHASSVAVATPPPVEVTPSESLEMAHVLFTDIVGYSMLPMDHQREVLGRLQGIVQATEEYRRAQAARDLVSLPTGDGMALVFSRDPTAPLRCAVEVARALKAYPQIRLRMGIHGGPVYRVADINANLNVAGGGINIAQRVMDCGDAGHILLSRAIADIVGQVSQWAEHLHDLGEHPVKHGVKVQLFNLYTGEVGNRETPSKLRAKPAEARKAPRAEPAAPRPQERKGGPPILLLAGVGVLVVAGVVATLLLKKKPSPTPSPTSVATATRELTYFLTVQKFRDGQPYREPFQLAREMLFGPDDRLRLTFASPQSGSLYIVNEGPDPKTGKITYNVLFPKSATGSALLSAGQEVRIPENPDPARWIHFDEAQGTEKLWLVFGAKEAPELEAVKGLQPVSDPGQIGTLQAFLTKHGASPPEAVKDETRKQTVLKGGDVLVNLVKLEHQ